VLGYCGPLNAPAFSRQILPLEVQHLGSAGAAPRTPSRSLSPHAASGCSAAGRLATATRTARSPGCVRTQPRASPDCWRALPRQRSARPALPRSSRSLTAGASATERPQVTKLRCPLQSPLFQAFPRAPRAGEERSAFTRLARAECGARRHLAVVTRPRTLTWPCHDFRYGRYRITGAEPRHQTPTGRSARGMPEGFQFPSRVGKRIQAGKFSGSSTARPSTWPGASLLGRDVPWCSLHRRPRRELGLHHGLLSAKETAPLSEVNQTKRASSGTD